MMWGILLALVIVGYLFVQLNWARSVRRSLGVQAATIGQTSQRVGRTDMNLAHLIAALATEGSLSIENANRLMSLVEMSQDMAIQDSLEDT